MLKFFKKDKGYTDKELFSALKKQEVYVSEQEIQRAQENDPKTIFHIASIYYNYKKNSSKAFAWFYKAALQNYGQAQFQVGLMHQYGEGVTQDYEMAMQWYQKAAKFENLDAMNYIAYLYRYGLGVAANLHTSIEWYTKAAIHGYTLAHYNLGYIYETKNEVKDLQKAIHWYKKAADKGHCIAEMQLEKLKEKGYYGKESEQIDEKVDIRTINSDNVFSSSSNDDQSVNNTNEDSMKSLTDSIHMRMKLIEEKNQESKRALLKKESDVLQQVIIRKNEEIKGLQGKLGKLEAQLEDNPDNNLNYDSSDDDNQNDFNYDTDCDNREKEDTQENNDKICTKTFSHESVVESRGHSGDYDKN